MRSLLSIHQIPSHMDYAGLAELNPLSWKIINPDPERCRRAYALAPNALFVLRDQPLSEQHDDMMRDPEATCKRHAQELMAHGAS